MSLYRSKQNDDCSGITSRFYRDSDCNGQYKPENDTIVKALDVYVTLNTWSNSDNTLDALGAPGVYTSSWDDEIDYKSLPEQLIPEENEQLYRAQLRAQIAMAMNHINHGKALLTDEEITKAFSDKAEAKKLVNKFVAAA